MRRELSCPVLFCSALPCSLRPSPQAQMTWELGLDGIWGGVGMCVGGLVVMSAHLGNWGREGGREGGVDGVSSPFRGGGWEGEATSIPPACVCGWPWVGRRQSDGQGQEKDVRGGGGCFQPLLTRRKGVGGRDAGQAAFVEIPHLFVPLGHIQSLSILDGSGHPSVWVEWEWEWEYCVGVNTLPPSSAIHVFLPGESGVGQGQSFRNLVLISALGGYERRLSQAFPMDAVGSWLLKEEESHYETGQRHSTLSSSDSMGLDPHITPLFHARCREEWR
ncbi:hypothetical protein BJ684DRAFT_14841 [Piptocephalis cylindrospora]|uniref:Uncharacterized protein n=1 Tax=Piptocephalis cylindrospora TaxID=1907219 RepID=A0A4P9Y781_9FUNG|nr:hypothetical protein BJ684DRAFT_14841 [Piptocephalis cylindrospora]|eukprot:RKP14863.1 hypothetical protein BJ684DRAFT_14841 [Piptocephalis cylindrospora]